MPIVFEAMNPSDQAHSIKPTHPDSSAIAGGNERFMAALTKNSTHATSSLSRIGHAYPLPSSCPIPGAIFDDPEPSKTQSFGAKCSRTHLQNGPIDTHRTGRPPIVHRPPTPRDIDDRAEAAAIGRI